LTPGDDIQIRLTGVRPGEKLYEELACGDEQTRPTAHDKIRVWQLPPADPRRVARGLELLAAAAEGTPGDAIAALMRCVPEYRPARGSDAAAAVSVGDGAAPTLRLAPADVAAADSTAEAA